MKAFNEEKAKKSWVLRLIQSEYQVNLYAVDSQTGDPICPLVIFYTDGSILTMIKSRDTLEKKGYNPFEHGNKFETESGKIVIT